MNAKYQIFISSTYEDLKDEREQVLKAILKLGHIPIGMEMFNAANQTQWQMIQRRIEESDYYIVIVAARYGSIEPESGLSYTEKEYEYANSVGVPTYGFVLTGDAEWPRDRMETDPKKIEALAKFVAKIESKMRAPWTNKDNLAANVSFALNDAFTAEPRIGWVRADQAASPETLNELTRLSKENADLREQLARSVQNITNHTLMPDIQAQMEIDYGRSTWYEIRQDDNSGKFDLRKLTSTEFGLSVDIVERNGQWIELLVSNFGTMKTGCLVELTVSEDIVLLDEVTAFQKRLDSVPIGSRDHQKRVAEAGWRSAEIKEGKITFSGTIEMLIPGKDYSFVLPIQQPEILKNFQDAIVQLQVFPETGKFLKKEFVLSELLGD